MPEFTIRVCDVAIRLAADDRSLMSAARKRYRPFLTGGSPDLSLDLTPSPRKLRSFRSEPRVVWDGRAGRVERHDLEVDLAPGLGRATIVKGLSPMDSLLRIVLSFELIKRGGFLCHSAAVDGWLFPGVSGAGKSTLGRSVPKHRLLADELVGVCGTRLWGTPFRGDFLPGRNPKSHALEAVFLLDRKGPRGIREVSKAEAMMRLLQCALYFGDDLRGGKILLQAVRTCVLRVRTFALGYDARRTTFTQLDSMIRSTLR